MRLLALHPATMISDQSRCLIKWLGLANGCVAVVCLIPIWFVLRDLEREISDREVQLETQRLLHPILQDLAEESATSRRLATYSKPVPAPDNLADLIVGMHHLAVLSGMKNALFVPASETIMPQENQIRLDGHLSGSLDSFRRFLLLASEQDWLIRLDSISIRADSGSPTAVLSLWARFKRL